MNLVEKLMAVNTIEKEQKKIKSKRLTKLVGEGAEITIQEISGRRFNDVKKRAAGAGDAEYEANLICCLHGIVEPNLKDEQLQKHFEVHTPKDLCEKLFSAEVYTIAGEIVELSGLTDDEDEVKN